MLQRGIEEPSSEPAPEGANLSEQETGKPISRRHDDEAFIGPSRVGDRAFGHETIETDKQDV